MSNPKKLRRLGQHAPDRQPRDICYGCLGEFAHAELQQIDITPIKFRRQPGCPGRLRRRVCQWCEMQFKCRTVQFESYVEWDKFWRPLDFGFGLFRNRPNKPRRRSRVYFIIPFRCHFCDETIGYLDSQGRLFNIHHQTERHTFEDKQEADRLSNLSYAHVDCHNNHHRQKNLMEAHQSAAATT